MTRALFASLALACLLGCGARDGNQSQPTETTGETRDKVQIQSAPPATLPEMIVPLNTEELRELISGASIIDGHMIWTYCESGIVHVSGTRGPYTRPYTISDGHVCIGGACSQLYRQGESYYMQFSGPSAALSPVILSPEGAC